MTTLAGETGKVLVGYQLALSIRDWVLTRRSDQLGPSASQLTATVTSVNRYWSNQQPLTLGLWMGNSWWVWPNVTFSSMDIDKTVHIDIKGDPVAKGEF